MQDNLVITLFPGRYETFNLLAPLLTFALVGIEFAIYRSVGPAPRDANLQIALFMAAAIGLNVLHNYLTFAMLVCVPELRAWVHAQSRMRPWLFWFKLALVFCATFIAFLLLNQIVQVKWPWLIPLLALPAILFPLHHYISQVFGLSQVYSVKARNAFDYSPSELKQVDRHLNTERICRKLVLGFYLAAVACSYLLLSRIREIDGSAARPFLESLGFFSLWGLRGAIGAVWINALRLPRVWQTNKLWFLTRVGAMLFPFAGPWVAAGSEFTHGFEYLGVFLQMEKQSKMKLQQRHQLFLVTTGLLLVGFFLLLFRRREGLVALLMHRQFDQLPLSFQLLAALSIALTFTHYYFDALIFKMRDAETRRLIGPLLAS